MINLALVIMGNTKLDSKAQPGNATVSYTSKYHFNTRPHHEPLRVLSEEDWKFWKNNGYVVVKQAVPTGNIEALVNLIWEFEEKDPKDRTTWYRTTHTKRAIKMTELRGTGMVEVYNHQTLWNNRQHQRVYDAFVDIWGTESLWVSIDRANLNLPHPRRQGTPSFIHWDIDTSLDPKPMNVQGVLALNQQTDPQMGGFQCIPALYREFDAWVKTQPADRDPFKPDISGFEIEKVALEAGDLLIWDSMLAHGIRSNLSDRPRLAQYIAMTPARQDNEELRQWRVRSWRDRIIPEGYPFPGDPRNWEQTRYRRAKLSELGEKLLGLQLW